jgi:hypothetical protein
LRRYEELFADELRKYQNIPVGATSDTVPKLAERLRELGYFPYEGRYVQPYYAVDSELARAVSLFKQFNGIGSDSDLDRLTQALLRSDMAVRPDFPMVVTRYYTPNRKDALSFHTYSDLQRINPQNTDENKCVIRGMAQSVVYEGNILTMEIALPDGKNTVRVNYKPPENSSQFLDGDDLTVFGTVATSQNDIITIEGYLIGFSK